MDISLLTSEPLCLIVCLNDNKNNGFDMVFIPKYVLF